MSKYCELHKNHSPEPLTSEQHHVTPQAWQHFKLTGHGVEARAMEARAGGTGWLATPLYDKRTVTLAPTCHRNVHFWIVKIMKAFENLSLLNQHIDNERRILDLAITNVRSVYHVRGAVFAVAVQAPSRYLEAGGSLHDLVENRLYGNA